MPGISQDNKIRSEASSMAKRQAKKMKKRLDRGYDCLSELVKKRTLPRSVGEPSSRAKPSDYPEWVCD